MSMKTDIGHTHPHGQTNNTGGTQRLVLVSMLAAVGLILFVFESFLPILPWFRPGLGNVATIIALFLFGWNDALKVTLLRVILGALVLGRLFTPLFLLALIGGLVSLGVMKMARVLFPRSLGPVGVSVMGAVFHNAAQLVSAYFLFIGSAELFIFLPVFLLSGVVTGNITGIMAAVIVSRLGRRRTIITNK